MTKRALVKTVLITLVSVISVSANPVDVASITPPRPFSGIQTLMKHANYPASAIETRFESEVLLSFRVDRFGVVSNIKVIESGGTLFDDSAINAVLNTEWIPASYVDQNIAIRLELPFMFKLP